MQTTTWTCSFLSYTLAYTTFEKKYVIFPLLEDYSKYICTDMMVKEQHTLTDLLIGGGGLIITGLGSPVNLKKYKGVLIVAPLPPKSKIFGPKSGGGDSKITPTKGNNGDTPSLLRRGDWGHYFGM